MNAHIEKMAREAGFTEYGMDLPKRYWDADDEDLYAFAKAIAEDLAGVVAPVGTRPCTCDICDCGNSGDLIAVTDWDTSNALAKAIRERYK